MTLEEFKAFSEGKTIIMDGAVGSNMMNGMPKGYCMERWNLEHKDELIALQKGYIEAGTQLISAPTFGANRISLTGYGLQDRLKEFNTTLVGYTQDAAAGKAIVAGDVTTSGKMMGYEDYDYEKAFENYSEQIDILAQAGVDLILAETMISYDEVIAAIDACNSVCSLPIICTMSVDSVGSAFYGGNIMDLAPEIEAAGAAAVGVNCSVAPYQLTSVIKTIAERVNIPVIAKPNAGMPEINAKGIPIYNLGAEKFGEQMVDLYNNGARILGGCCGTTPSHIRSLAEHLK